MVRIRSAATVDGRIRAFSLAHHFGVLEGVWKAGEPRPENTLISAEGIECITLGFVISAVEALHEKLGVELPFVVRLTIVGGAEATIKSENHDRYRYSEEMHLSRIGRDALVFPDVLLERWPLEVLEVADAFRPVFDRLWQTTGYVRSSMYQKGRDGRMQWQGRAV